MSVNVIIVAPSYNPQIGGAIVLHKLCDILNQVGIKSYLTTSIKLNGASLSFSLNSQFNTHIAETIDVDRDIIVYPEIERGNPYGAKNVVRYILSKAHTVNTHEGPHNTTWGSGDFWIYLHELFYDGLADKNVLHVIHSKVDIYYDMQIDRTVEECFTYRKGGRVANHSTDSIEIHYNTPDHELLQIFNKCKRFYSYDTETYLNVLAALCGCESIIIPTEGKSKKDIITNQPTFKYGIAYGVEDIKHAKETQHLMQTHLQGLEQSQIENTKTMFNKIITHFNL